MAPSGSTSCSSGADQRPGEDTFNTDTMIVVSIDPVTGQVAMFSLPRDTVDVPVPPGPAQSVWGTTYGGKINVLVRANRNRSDLLPGTASQRGYNALKAILGNLYGLDIRTTSRSTSTASATSSTRSAG